MSEKLFNVGIKGVIVKDGKVLLLRANAAKERRDMWEMPGGRIDQDETIKQTLTRELEEEVPNIKNVEIGELLDVFQTNWETSNGVGLILVFYKVSADFDGELTISDEHVDIRWCDQAEALKIAAENCQTAIKKAFKNDRNS